MKKIIRLLTVLLLFVTCISCDKEDRLRKYHIVDSVTKNGVPDVRVTLFKVEKQFFSIFGGVSRVMIEETYTKADGSFAFDYRVDRLNNDYCITTHAKYYCYASSFHSRFPEDQSFSIVPKGFVNIRVHKVDTTTEKTFSFSNGLFRPKIKIKGRHIDTTFTAIYTAGQYETLKWKITENRETTVQEGEPVYIPPHDTTDYEIIFF